MELPSYRILPSPVVCLQASTNQARSRPKGSRAHGGDQRTMETEYREESIVIAKQIKAYAEKRGMTALQYAILWLLNNAVVASVVAGPRTFEQWQDYVGALAHEFTAEDEAFLDRLVPSGHPSTPGFTDPRYPHTGRMALTG